MRAEAVSSLISGIATVYAWFNIELPKPVALKSLLKRKKNL
jgi:hypothetical protein